MKIDITKLQKWTGLEFIESNHSCRLSLTIPNINFNCDIILSLDEMEDLECQITDMLVKISAYRIKMQKEEKDA